jgi:hypothetical protein
MHSNTDILTALDTIEEALHVLARQPLTQLRPADQRAVLLRVDAADKQFAAFGRRVLRTLVTGPMPVQFGGTSWADVLARRLHISVGEAQRRITEALHDQPKSA